MKRESTELEERPHGPLTTTRLRTIRNKDHFFIILYCTYTEEKEILQVKYRLEGIYFMHKLNVFLL